MFADADLKLAWHEAAHAAVAWLLGLRVTRVTIDPYEVRTGARGCSSSEFRADDPRSAVEMAGARAMVVYSALRADPVGGQQDLNQFLHYCRRYGLSETRVKALTRDVMSSERYRACAAALQLALLEEFTLPEARVNAVCAAAAAGVPSDREVAYLNRLKACRRSDAELRVAIAELSEL